MTYNVTVNENCIGCWACIAICSEVFDFDENWTAFVKNNTNSSTDCIESAKDACPVWAIES